MLLAWLIFLNISSSLSMLLAWLIFLNISSASTLSGFLSGWYFSASLRYFFLISAAVEVLGISSSSYRLLPDLLNLEMSFSLDLLLLDFGCSFSGRGLVSALASSPMVRGYS